MMFIKAAAAVALLASSVTAQFSINGTLITASTAAGWCAAEISTCGILCSGASNPNNCSTTTGDYSCICKANNSAPGLQYYQNTMPYFICEQVYANCINAGANDAAAQKLCTQARDNDCGKLDPSKFVASSSSSSSSSPSSASASRASSAASSTSSASSTSASGASTSEAAAAAALRIGTEYKSGMFAVGLAAVFGFLL